VDTQNTQVKAAIKALDPPKVIGISSGGGGIADLKAIAAATGALAPVGGIDCNNDGIIDIPAGALLGSSSELRGSRGVWFSIALYNTLLSDLPPSLPID